MEENTTSDPEQPQAGPETNESNGAGDGPIFLYSDVLYPLASTAKAFWRMGLSTKVWCAEPEWRAVLEQSLAAEKEAVDTPHPPEVEWIQPEGDKNPAKVERLNGCSGLVILSPVEPTGRVSKEPNHIEMVRSFVSAAEKAGVKTLAYQSTPSAHPQSRAECLRDAAEAEQIVEKFKGEGYILRTAPLCGRGVPWAERLVERATARKLWMGVLSYGDIPVQPLHLDDFGRATSRLFTKAGMPPGAGVYTLAGPEATTLMDISDRISERVKRFKIKFHLPGFILGLFVLITSPLGKLVGPIREQSALLDVPFDVEKNEFIFLAGHKPRAKSLSSMIGELVPAAGQM